MVLLTLLVLGVLLWAAGGGTLRVGSFTPIDLLAFVAFCWCVVSLHDDDQTARP